MKVFTSSNHRGTCQVVGETTQAGSGTPGCWGWPDTTTFMAGMSMLKEADTRIYKLV